MSIFDTHKCLRDNFVYKQDKDFDHWKIWPKDIKIYDDCDGFSLNLVYRHFGCFWKPLIEGKAKIYYVTVGGSGHMISMIDGYFCDNIMTTPQLKLPVTYKNIKKYSTFEVFIRIVFTKSAWFNKLKRIFG